MRDATRSSLDSAVNPAIDDPVARAFRHVLAGTDVDDPEAVCRAIRQAGQSYVGNAGAIERATHAIRQSRAAPPLRDELSFYW